MPRKATKASPSFSFHSVFFVSSFGGGFRHVRARQRRRRLSQTHLFFGPRVAFVINVITALGIFLLARASSFPAGCIAAALIGVGAGGEAATTPYLLTRYFGLRAFSTLYGLTWTFYAAAGAIGPVILGRAFDATGSYSSLLVLLAAVLALTAATNLLLPRYSDAF
jgi:MFS family permease